MKNFLTAFLITGALFMGGQVNAQKFGYISADDIIMLMPESATMQTQFHDYQNSLLQNAQDKNTAFNDALAKFNKDSATMSASLKEVKRGELQKQVVELNNQQQIIQQEMQTKQQQLLAPIQKKLQDAINAVAKEQGYTYIFAREALIVVPDKDDIGPLVMKKLNLKAPETPPSAMPGK